jgi:hypothetical protein
VEVGARKGVGVGDGRGVTVRVNVRAVVGVNVPITTGVLELTRYGVEVGR